MRISSFVRFLLLPMLLLLLMSMSGYAQTRNIFVKFADDKVGIENAEVYSFKYELEAKKAYARLQDEGSLDKQHDNYIAKTITGVGNNKGRSRINVPANGWLVVDLIESRYIIGVAATKVIDNEHIIEIKKSKTDEMFQKMKEASVSFTRFGRKKEVPGEGSTCGGMLVIKPYPVCIDSIYARNNARFVLSPIVISRDNPKDTIGYLPPRIMDGVDYDPSQVRYMGFDKHNDRYWRNIEVFGDEPSVNYFHSGMRTRENDTLYFRCKIRPYNDKKPWKIIGHCWYEDYKNVYYEKNILLYAGYTTKPEKFLEWRSSIPEEYIDVSHYAIMARTEAITTPMTLRLDFRVGEATLNYADSLTVAGLNSVESSIQSIKNNDNAEFHGISLHGYASPEGNEAGNRSLALRRTQTVRDYLAHRFSDLHVKSLDSEIVPWTEVADTIDALKNPKYNGIAEELRDICQQRNTLDAQGQIIRTKPWYRMVTDSVLPLMRRVKIETEYVEQKELTSKEIFQRYENTSTKAPFTSGTAPAYQYFQLMNYLYDNQDWEALYQVSKLVYNLGVQACKAQDDGSQLIDVATRSTLTNQVEKITSRREEITDVDGKKTFVTRQDTLYVMKSKEVRRPYPLAAYYMAKSKLELGKIEPSDTLLLLDYLDDSKDGLYNDPKDENEAHHYWNEEAFAIAQVLIHCAINDYSRARYHSLYHLPRNKHYETFQSFLKFMSCDYEEDKEHIRQVIERTSPNNYVVANLTKEEINGEMGFKRALRELQENQMGFMHEDTLDATYYYLLAICLYQVDCKEKDYETYFYNSKNVYDPHNDIAENQHWGAPMLEAIKLNPKWAEFLKEDGFFNDAYRSMILFFWQRMQDGEEMENIAREYDELANKYFSDKK